MAKYKPINDQQMVMLPISLQEQLVSGTLEHAMSEVVDKHMDLSVFDARCRNDQTGAAAIPRYCSKRNGRRTSSGDCMRWFTILEKSTLSGR